LYLSGGACSDLCPAFTIDISSNLQAALVDEYSNEKVPSDGEVYLKVRQYQQEGNARFEERWMARLSANKAKRFRQLNSHVDVRAAFDRLRIIPALLVQGMKFGSIPRALATNCFEVRFPSMPNATRPELSRIGDSPWPGFVTRVVVLLRKR
jgi:hypothetical protein